MSTNEHNSASAKGHGLTFDFDLGLEGGVKYLQGDGWLPPRCDPLRVAKAIANAEYDLCRGVQTADGLVWSNVVERLAIAHALVLASGAAPTSHRSAIPAETIETIGHEVTPDFAERGSDAVLLMQFAADLLGGIPHTATPLRRDLAFRALGRLWVAAFDAPPGYDYYIAQSAAGDVPPELNFFEAVPDRPIDGVVLGTFVSRLVDLLQAAIAMKDLPESTVGAKLRVGDWANRVGFVLRGTSRARRESLLEVHTQRVGAGRRADRISVKFVDPDNNQCVGACRVVLLKGRSGSYDDLVHEAAAVGGATEATVNGAFAAAEVVTIHPRVRRLLDQAENQLFKLVVLDGLYVPRDWRHRQMGHRLIRQALVETGQVEAVLGLPGAYPIGSVDDAAPASFGIQCGYAAARLRLAHYWHAMGADFLIHGVMGMPLPAILTAIELGTHERLTDPD